MQTQEYVKVTRPEISDAVLAQQTLAGDQRAFEVLVHRYSASLFNFIYRFVGDYDQSWDILQRVFLRFYTYLPRLNSREPYKAWLFRVARNCCVDELRRRRRHAIHFSQLESTNDEYETSLLDDIPGPSPLPATAKTYFHRGKQLLRTTLQTQSPALLTC